MIRKGVNSMTIEFKGKLRKSDQLEQTNLDNFKKLQPNFLDYILVLIILAYPVLCGVKLLIGSYRGNLIILLFGDIAGLIVVILLMIFHELLHAKTFSKQSHVQIWYKGFMMMTYCTEEKKAYSMLYTLLLPNLIITLPVAVFAVFLSLLPDPSLFTKIYGLVSLIIILGANSDLINSILIFRKIKVINIIKINQSHFYYK